MFFNDQPQFRRIHIVDFNEALYELAETCQFGDLKNELIRDRIVVGIRNARLLQKLIN
jgi:uncharacterized protein YifN (PemK superfamily)